jgi:glycosyltransferase involved in cell wall biosynthesis
LSDSKAEKSDSKAENIVVLNHPIEELFLVCDVFLAVATTTLLEAIILGKPVIVIQVSEKINRDVFSLVESGAAIGAKFEELAEKVLEVLNNNALAEELRAKGSEFAKQHFNLPNRGISLRIADMLIDPDKKI